MSHFSSKSLLVAIVLSLSMSGTTLAQDAIKLRFAGTLPLKHHVSEGQQKFADLVAKETKGRVKIEVYPSGSLYKAWEIATAVPTGAVDMGFNLSNVWSKGAVGEISDVPFLFRNTEHAEKAWAQDGKLFQAFSADMAKRNMKTICVMSFGSLFDITNNGHQLRIPGDFKGMKIRSYGALASESLRALGAAPTNMDPGEMYLAMQGGTVNGAITGITSIDERKLWEVGKFTTLAGAAFGVMVVNVNAQRWAKLPPDVQRALIAVGKEVQDWSFKESAKRDDASLEFIRSKGVSAIKLTPAERAKWVETLAPVVESWKKRASKDEVAVFDWVASIK